jgi:hypothetical protein
MQPIDESQELVALVAFLEEAPQRVEDIDWNGLGFDLMSGRGERLFPNVKFGFDHIDMMFHFFACEGRAGLDQAAKGMGVPGKPPDERRNGHIGKRRGRSPGICRSDVWAPRWA